MSKEAIINGRASHKSGTIERLRKRKKRKTKNIKPKKGTKGIETTLFVCLSFEKKLKLGTKGTEKRKIIISFSSHLCWFPFLFWFFFFPFFSSVFSFFFLFSHFSVKVYLWTTFLKMLHVKSSEIY